MRICLYTNTAFPSIGGQEVVVDELAKQYQQAGHYVVVVAPDHPQASGFDRQAPYQIARHPRFISTRWLLSWYGSCFKRLQQRHQFDVVHCHNIYPAGYVALMLGERRPLVAITSHGGDVREDNPRFSKPGLISRHRRVLSDADAIVSIGPFTDEGFSRLGVPRHKMHRITNGVHVDHLSQGVSRPDSLPASLQNNDFYLFLGRLAHRKGVDVLLRAIALMKHQGKHKVKLAIGGDGPERSNLEALAQQAGISDNVVFLGKVAGDTKRWLLQQARCMVIPTREWEALPMVLLEAHAAGCPVLASDAPGLLGLVEQDVTGWVTAREDHVALARQLQIVDDMPMQRIQSIRDAGKQKARKYDWPCIAEQHITLFEQLHDQRAGLKSAA